MKILIFSKDRAQQLHLLLSSFGKNFPNINYEDINIIYTYSNDKFKAGYELLQETFRYTPPSWYLETNFSADLLLHFIVLPRSIGLFTDDCVIYRRTDIDSTFIDNMLADEQNLCISLRLGVENSLVQNYLTGETHKSIKEYGTTNINQNQMFKYRWGLFPSQSNPGYMGSIDGCFYDSQYLLDATKNVTITCPRALEENLANNHEWRQKMMSKKPYLICPRHSNVVVNSINFVQSTPVQCGNKFHYSPSDLNDKYLAGEVIDLDDFLSRCENIQGAHTEIPLTFRRY